MIYIPQTSTAAILIDNVVYFYRNNGSETFDVKINTWVKTKVYTQLDATTGSYLLSMFEALLYSNTYLIWHYLLKPLPYTHTKRMYHETHNRITI